MPEPSHFQDKVNEKLQSPEMLDERLVVISSKGWIALCCACLLLIGGVFWAFFGEIPSTISTKTIFLNPEGLEIIQSPVEGKLDQIFVKEGEEVEQGTLLATLQKNASQQKISSTDAGKILEILAIPNTDIEKDAPLFLIEKEKGERLFYAFIPIEISQEIKPGMTAYIQIPGINSQIYGQLIGKVSSLSPFVVSQHRLYPLLGDQNLIDYFVGQNPVVEVVIEPQKDERTPSGYLWTSEQGPPGKIPPRSIGTALIVLQSRRPISYVFPYFHREKDLH